MRVKGWYGISREEGVAHHEEQNRIFFLKHNLIQQNSFIVESRNVHMDVGTSLN